MKKLQLVQNNAIVSDDLITGRQLRHNSLLYDEPESESESETWTGGPETDKQSRSSIEAKTKRHKASQRLTSSKYTRLQNKQSYVSKNVGGKVNKNNSLYAAALNVHKTGNRLKVTRKSNGVRVDNQHCWFEVYVAPGTNNRFDIVVGYMAGGATLVSRLKGYRQGLGQKFIDINMLVPVVELSRSPGTGMYIGPPDLDQFTGLKLSETIAKFLTPG